MSSQKPPLILPCLRGYIGDWVYYVAMMRLESIVERIKVGPEIYGNRELCDMLQRLLTKRAPQIGDYLVRTRQRFFNALVAAMYEGEPTWYPIDVGTNALVPEIPEYVSDSIGILTLSGKEKVFALDGQHRLKGIEAALRLKPKLSAEELPVVFVGHRETTAGKQRTRRLFSTLNRYAKPVSLGEIIILDEDDPMAITTRSLVDKGGHALLSRPHVIYIGKTKTVAPTNKKCITSIQALYEVLEILFFPSKTKKKIILAVKTARPSQAKLDKYYKTATIYLNTLISEFPELHEFSKKNEDGAAQFRNNKGGHLLFRPVGLLSITRAVRVALDSGWSLKKIVSRLAKIPMDLASAPWAGLLWNSQSNTMIIKKKNQEVASLLLLYIVGFNLRKIGITRKKLKDKYADGVQRDVSEVRLPPRIRS